MTRARIAEGLMLLVLQLGNSVDFSPTPDGWQDFEWAYLKGVASGEILRLRKVVLEAGE